MAMYIVSPDYKTDVVVHSGEIIPVPVRSDYRVQCDGDELVIACALLGRSIPPRRVFTFCGYEVMTILLNWTK